MSGKGMGMTVVVDVDDRAVGIFTDGDLRRALARGSDVMQSGVATLMTRSPRKIEAGRLAADCVVMMETPPRVMQLVVVDATGRLAGALHMHDLFRAQVI
jgi:arabinose-5-phosphate isomerase